MILTVVTLLVGVTVFMVMQRHAEIELNQAGQVVGKVMTEKSPPATTGAIKDATRLGETGERALCAPFGLKIQCFPTTLNPLVNTTLSQRSSRGDLLPMAHALAGKTGFINTQDYRNQEVEAAYAPVGDLGLGMVLKMDSAELHAPAWTQLRYLIPLLLGGLIIALLLLRWLLAPLVLRLVGSEAQAREMSASLHDSESRVRAVLDNVHEGIVTISASGMIELFNPAAERIFGYRREEVIGKNVSMLMPEPYHSEHGGYLSRYLRTGQAQIIGIGREVAGRRSDGSLFPMDLGIAEVSLEGRRQFIGSIRDITERQTAELALRKSEENFRQMVDTSLESILQTRPDGRVLNANPAACALFGMSVQEMRERGRGGLVDTSDPRLPALLAEREREGQVYGELRMVRSDGSVFECELSSSIFLDLDNRSCSNIVLRDITERKRAEAHSTRLNAELEQRVGERTAQLEASNRDLQEFAHSVAHDLRQPFIAIGGFIGLLERSVEDERARHYVNRIKDGVRQAGELTDALLALANLSRVELRLQEVDLSTLAFSVMDKLQQQDPDRVCRIHIEPGLRAQADAMLIRLVLEELLGNAWKFTSRRSQTEIGFGMLSEEAGTSGAEPVYVVRDNGEGFDMAHADKLFRSFQRLHTAQDFPGAGVGLANCQRIVARHGGRIWAESALGEGSGFFFTLGNDRP